MKPIFKQVLACVIISVEHLTTASNLRVLNVIKSIEVFKILINMFGVEPQTRKEI